MRKEEFLQILRRALTGDVPPGIVEENIRYYDGYITEEVRRGRTEEEVIAEIGDPRLIARTIEDTTDTFADSQYHGGSAYEYGKTADREDDTYGQNSYGTGGSVRRFRFDKWYWKLLLALIIFGLLYLVIMVIGGIFALLAPLIGPLFLIWMIITIFRGLGRR